MNLSGDTLNASYAFCRRLSRRSGSNFYLGFLLLPQEKRWAMEALYAFMRYSDDLIDEAPQSGLNGHLESAIDQRLDRLERWRSILEIAFADLGRLSAGSIPEGESTAMFLLPALVDTVKRFNIPVEHLYAVLDGVEMDLHGCRYETFEELKLYCQRVASAVGLACIHIWGYRGQGTDRGEAVFEPAQQAGIALQLTNILRDFKADA
ncbi:MAG TPA: phytoene/squalene synthase family protein, partial [Thermoguttaceae bacterium]